MRMCLSSLLVLVVVVDVAFGSLLTMLMENVSRPNVNQSRTTNRARNMFKPPGVKKNPNLFTSTWTKLLETPPDTMEVAVGSRVELHCEVIGNPPPQVYWLTGYEQWEKQSQELVMQASEKPIGKSAEWEGLSQIYSTYVIDCVRPEDQGLKYCVALSKNMIQTAATMLLVNSSKVVECNKESQPTITLYQTWRLALEGTTVILPCKVEGQPTPYLFWTDNSGKTITPTTHTRHTVLPSGDLKITDTNWGDMGDYVCTVQSGFTEKSVSTFLYTVYDGEKSTE